MSQPNLASGERVIIKVTSDAHYKGAEQINVSSLQGEFELRAEEASSSSSRKQLSLVRLGFYGVGYPMVGSVSLRGISGDAVLDGQKLTLSFTGGLTYNALERFQYVENPENDHFGAVREKFTGNITATLSSASETNSAEFSLNAFSLNLTPQTLILGMIEGINIPHMTGPGSARIVNLDDGLSCPPKFRALRRRLRIRAVFFKDHRNSTATGSQWCSQRDAAIRIWAKCGIDLDEVKPPAILPNHMLTDPLDIVLSYFDDPGIILVFFIAGRVPGGGWTFADGAAHARCLLSDQIMGNTNVLAHELGHVLDGDHPGGFGPFTTWSGEPCTVLLANGSLTIPNSDQNTLHNCLAAKNDATESLEAICLAPDTCRII